MYVAITYVFVYDTAVRRDATLPVKTVCMAAFVHIRFIFDSQLDLVTGSEGILYRTLPRT
jgi:hypothetical protein